ncbi:hypothetical protein KAM28_004491 [Salmonella enterica subsp. diarizonae serovar 47:k:z53:[z84]]|nr:hypothetical protein [Salmonella enterica subsp. diarizonae serovar 47:k:z53:[z84]]
MIDFIFNDSDCGCLILASRSMTVFPGMDEPFRLFPQQMLLLPERNDVSFSHGAMVQVFHLNRDIVNEFLQYMMIYEGACAIRQRNMPDYLVEI